VGPLTASPTSEVIASPTPLTDPGGVNVKEVPMADVNATIESWFASLNETDAARRAEHLTKAFADGGRWVDPPFEGQGHEAINAMLDGVYEQYPGSASAA
jgi:hypothetical protein